MPKRAYFHNKTKCAKSSLTKNKTEPANSDDNGNESNDQAPVEEQKKRMQYLKSNKNNEVERLLLHNSKLLIYHVNHSDFPAFNVGVWPQEANKITTYPSLAFSAPRPIFVANKQGEKIDICFKRSMIRDNFLRGMKHTRSTYQATLKSNKNIRKSIKDGIYHTSVFDLAERKYTQPDPYFHSSYDFYFTGGNMCVLPHSGQIVHTGGEQLKEIFVSEFPEVDEYNDAEYLNQVASYKMRENCEIFEVHPLVTSVGSSCEGCFITRQRNVISFNYLNDNKKIKTITQFRTKTTPFISFAQSERNANKFIITTMKQDIRLYDLGNNVPAFTNLFKISSNSTSIAWNTVKPWRENTFLYANERQLYLIDIRTSPDQWLKKTTFASDSLKCDHLSAVMPSDFNNLFYVATNHKLSCMDIRRLNNSSLSNTEDAICRWSHQLRYAPLMIDKLRFAKTEYIALSSPISGDLHICQLSRERNKLIVLPEPQLQPTKHTYRSPCLPYQPPTILEAYENARLSGKCLNPKANLEARLKCCTTGMKFFKSSSQKSMCVVEQLLTLNSNGDIFAHTITKREQEECEKRCNSQSDNVMADFEAKICNQAQPSLNYSYIKDMKGLRKVFLCKYLSSNNQYDFNGTDNEYDEPVTSDNNERSPQKKRRKRLHFGRWQKSISKLHSYKDALVADLLSIWDIDIEEENKINLSKLRPNVKIDPNAKVEDWLKQSLSRPPMLSIPISEVSRYVENEASQTLDSTMTQIPNTTIDFGDAIHSTQIFENSTHIATNLDISDTVIHINNENTTIVLNKLKNKKKNKYTKGF